MDQAPPEPHQPFVADQLTLPELSVRALLLGTTLGIVFGASSLYLVLKVGLTVSASHPGGGHLDHAVSPARTSWASRTPASSRTTSCRRRAARANRSRLASA